jgi:EAL domain-containing protein (putative c-di-GMP-specific phosphodiesterase class I)
MPALRPHAHSAQLPLLAELEAAVRSDALMLHFQPVVSLLHGRRTAARAMPRWPHRQRGLILPQTFMKLAAEAGLEADIAAWSVAASCAAAGRMRSGHVILPVPARYLAAGTLPDTVTHAITTAGLAPDRLELAFDEPVLIDILRTNGDVEILLALSALRDLGVGVALDAFGAGPASLSLLRRLPVTSLRLAPSMTHRAPTDAHDRTILKVAISAGQALGLRVGATGVETEPQRLLLLRLGCDEAEGRLFGPPGPIERLRQLP